MLPKMWTKYSFCDSVETVIITLQSNLTMSSSKENVPATHILGLYPKSYFFVRGDTHKNIHHPEWKITDTFLNRRTEKLAQDIFL